jgi:Flp pilus assembly protein TadG
VPGSRRAAPSASTNPGVSRTGRPAFRRGAWMGRRGSVTLEFVLTAPILLFLLGFTLDFSLLLRARIALAGGMMNAVQYAMMTGTSVTAANLISVLQQASPLSGMTATVSGPACYCPSAYPVTLSPATCGVTCAADGTAAGTYVLLTATYDYTPMMPGVSAVAATTVTQTAAARLQ